MANRALDRNRKDDSVSNFKVDLHDIDTAIVSYLKEIAPTLDENENTVKPGVVWGNPERWKAVRKDGVYRDQKGKIVLPLIMIKRNSISRNDNMAMLNRHLSYNTRKKWSSKNKYDRFSTQVNLNPTIESYNVVMPDYINVFYECILWTEYTEHMNKLIETINWASDEYWGTDDKFKFKAKIEDYTPDVDVSDGQQRVVKTTFQINVTAYLLKDVFGNEINTKLTYSPKRIIFGTEVVDDIEDVDEAIQDGSAQRLTTKIQSLDSIIRSTIPPFDETRIILLESTASNHDNRITILEAGGATGFWLTGSTGIYYDVNNVSVGTNTATAKFTVSGSTDLTGSLNVTGIISGDGSGLTNVVSSSYAITASYAENAGGAVSTYIQKAGIESNSVFGGSPYSASIVFATEFTNNNYSIIVTGEDARTWTIQNKISGSFEINSNSSVPLTGSTFWQATETGEHGS